ncbi:hypothetical protein N7486_007912 [Penicillium sp. IBT 16267x]|nr:hypothetical protein N7486_007912 [Penicillium sp. IBT 16267x]
MSMSDQNQANSTSPESLNAAQQQNEGAEEQPEEQPRRDAETSHEKYSVFTVEKRAIVVFGSLASFFSPLSSSIYFPALDTIATALNLSKEEVDLTVTTYLESHQSSSQDSPILRGRPAYMICFTLQILDSVFKTALLLCSSSDVSKVQVAVVLGALANGLVEDVFTSEERGKYIAFASFDTILGPTISPIIGGLISQYLDWHWIFWFLLILGGVFFLVLLLFLPETCRKVVGDGSVPPPLLNMSMTDLIRQKRRKKKGLNPDPEKVTEVRKNYRLRFPSPLPTLKVILDLETSLILLTSALLFTCFYGVLTEATTSFHQVYHFDNIQSGLMYIPIGAGGTVSVFTTGRLVDWNYRRHAKWAGLPVLRNVRQDIRNFNVEKARLEIALPLYYLSIGSVIVYGWVLGRHVSLAAPVVLLFISGFAINGSVQALNALMVDIWPGRAAAATAANSLFHCWFGAASSAAIGPMNDAIGPGWAYTTLGLVAITASPCLWFMMTHGIKWRQKRIRKEEGSPSNT